ncbi:ribonuclease [Elizabethkingia meningoseptica]|uniref:ribonuclease domain-containing protein n=1 Tax=Elizabethkingia meningoseptica TaxID=238 RepID=UPI0008420AF8|nr:ribonuclease domain-containing protein [Elizabethkingia meningoseptica]MDE5438816.1 ribonuclease [Elizabethkingia meningoseptica]MDE5450861.1 ribonuclease [Elizabethkingia meningoseptica]MDE5507951.1 ribonuclease [Elizabethkingia meningoseptica]MDE5516181.1 ribonuclease [Elizabethkingia meningoseptica]MDE5526446.1 ribonuclease [Elizabethkingia meningoseptica]
MKTKFLFLAILAIFTACSHDDSRSDVNPVLKTNAEAKVQTVSQNNIAELTKESVVVSYVKTNNRLPDYYITKAEATRQGWVASKGNLCTVLPGRAIGGDTFGNREGLLPKKTNRKYYEADLNYNCGNRNADRLIYSNDGLVYVTKDHYKTFQQK